MEAITSISTSTGATAFQRADEQRTEQATAIAAGFETSASNAKHQTD